jgi:hypothetical protein
MGTRVGSIFFFSELVLLNFFRLQNLIAHRSSGSPSLVTARLECTSIPHTVCFRSRPALSLRLLVSPVAEGNTMGARHRKRPIDPAQL